GRQGGERSLSGGDGGAGAACQRQEPRAGERGDREEPGGAVGRSVGGIRARRLRAAAGSAEPRGLAAGQGRGDPSPARPGPVLPRAAPGSDRRRAGGEVGCGGPRAPRDAGGRS
ncbi:unnamed protein product, partial [Coccothraustes coccothraustes]